MTTLIQTLNDWGENFLSFAWPILWQSSLLIAIVFVFDALFARRLRAAVRYALWLVVLVKLLLPPALALPTGAAWWLWPAKPPLAPLITSEVVTFDPSAAPLPTSIPKAIPFVPTPPKLTSAGWAMLGYVAIGAALLLWLGIRWLRIAAKVRRATSFSDQRNSESRPSFVVSSRRATILPLLGERAGVRANFLQAGHEAPCDLRIVEALQEACQLARSSGWSSRFSVFFNATRQRIGLRERIQLKLVEDVQSPAVYGLFRPVILLPRALAEKLSTRQLRAVLLHEAIHLRRGDVWVHCAQTLLQIAWWWHPLLWLANARIRRLREEAVDDAVMLALRHDADAYAPTLLEVAKFSFRRPLSALALVGILESRSALRRRIERLVDFQPPRKAGLTFLSLCGIFAFSAAALPMGQGPSPAGALELQTTKVGTNAFSPNLWKVNGPQIQTSNANASAGISGQTASALNQALAAERKAAHMVLLVQANTNRLQTSFPFNPQLNLSELNHIHLDQFGPFQHARLPVVIDHLSWKISAIPILTVPKLLNSGQTLVDLPRLTNAALPDVLEAIVKGANQPIQYSLIDRFIVFSPAPPPANLSDELYDPVSGAKIFVSKLPASADSSQTPSQPFTDPVSGLPVSTPPSVDGTNYFEMRTFKINPGVFFPNLRQATGLQFDEHTNISTILTQLFKKKGVDLSSPKNVYYNPRLGVIFVYATPKDLDVIERIIGVLDGPVSEKYGLLKSLTNESVSLDYPLSNPITGAKVFGSFSTPVGPDGLEAKTFCVGTAAFNAAIQQKTGQTNILQGFNELAADAGVDLSPPKQFFFTKDIGALYVQANTNDLKAIARLITNLHCPPPMVHIKARFLEVPKSFFADVHNYLPAGVTNGTGVLPNPDYQVLWHELENQKDVEILAEPEVTTLCGRQTEMRATIIQPVVTKFMAEENVTHPDVSVNPQVEQLETGPRFDVVAFGLSDGYTLSLEVTASCKKFLGYADAMGLSQDATNSAGAKVTLPVVLPIIQDYRTSTQKNLWDGQTMVLFPVPEPDYLGDESSEKFQKRVANNIGAAEKKESDKTLVVLVTATLIDQAGNRLHSNDEMPFAQKYIPQQPAPAILPAGAF